MKPKLAGVLGQVGNFILMRCLGQLYRCLRQYYTFGWIISVEPSFKPISKMMFKKKSISRIGNSFASTLGEESHSLTCLDEQRGDERG